MADTDLDDDLIEGEAPEGEESAIVAEPTPEEAEARAKTEGEARKYGWRARDEFDREPKNWVDADRYLELPATQNKVLRDEIKALRESAEAEGRARAQEIERIGAVASQAAERVRSQERARYEGELAQIAARKRAAVAAADTGLFDQLDQYERQVRQAPRDEPVEPTLPPEDRARVTAYQQANAWAQDPRLWAEAVRAVEELHPTQRGTTAQQLSYAEGYIRRQYPQAFQVAPAPVPAPAPAPVSRVDGGGLGTGARRGKGAADLSAEARKVGQEFVRDGIYKSLDEYARDIFQEGVQ